MDTKIAEKQDLHLHIEAFCLFHSVKKMVTLLIIFNGRENALIKTSYNSRRYSLWHKIVIKSKSLFYVSNSFFFKETYTLVHQPS